MKTKSRKCGGFIQIEAAKVTIYDAGWHVNQVRTFASEEGAKKFFKTEAIDGRSKGNARKHDYHVTYKGDKL